MQILCDRGLCQETVKKFIMESFGENGSWLLAQWKVLEQPKIRGGSRTAATSKMECFLIIVNGFQPLSITIKHSIFDVAASLDPPLWTQVTMKNSGQRVKPPLIAKRGNILTKAETKVEGRCLQPLYTYYNNNFTNH